LRAGEPGFFGGPIRGAVVEDDDGGKMVLNGGHDAVDLRCFIKAGNHGCTFAAPVHTIVRLGAAI